MTIGLGIGPTFGQRSEMPKSIVATTPISVSGTRAVGWPLTRVQGSYSGAGTVMVTNGRWTRDGTDIPGETGAVYAQVAADQDRIVRWSELATDNNGSRSFTSVGTPTIAVAILSGLTLGSQAAHGDNVQVRYVIDRDSDCYFVLLSASATPPGVVQIVAGTDGDGTPAPHAYSTSLMVSGSSIDEALPDGLDDTFVLYGVPAGSSIVTASNATAINTVPVTSDVTDTFTVVSSTGITAFVGESGLAWGQVQGAGKGIAIDPSMNRCVADGTTSSRVFRRGTADLGDSYAEVTVRRGSSNPSSTGVTPALCASSNNFIYLRWRNSTEFEVRKWVGGTITVVATVTNGPGFTADGDTVTVRVERSGGQGIVKWNGSTIYTSGVSDFSDCPTGTPALYSYGRDLAHGAVEVDDFVGGAL